MKYILLFLTLSLYSVEDPKINLTPVKNIPNMYVGVDVATGYRFLLVSGGNGVAMMPLPEIKVVPVVLPRKIILPSENVLEINKDKMGGENNETYVNERDVPGQLEKLKDNGWSITGTTYDDHGNRKYKLQRLFYK